MNDSLNCRTHMCAASVMFVIFIVLFVAHATTRSRLFRLKDEPAPVQVPPDLLHNLNLKPTCSFDVFKEIAKSREDGYISGNGTWKRNARGVPEYFQPEICRFRHGINIPREEVYQCIKRHGLKYVVFAGDSNSLRYYSVFQTLLSDVGARCSRVRADRSRGAAVDPAYYHTRGNDIGPLLVHERDCTGCINSKIRCDIIPANISIIVELLSVEFTIDSEVTSFLSFRKCLSMTASKTSKWKPCRATTTTQQFLLKEYLASSPPDLLVLFGNSHDSNRYTLQEHAMNVRILAEMVDLYLPPKTKLIWTSKPAEYIAKKPLRFKGSLYENGTMNIIQWLIAANRIHYRELKKRFVENHRPLMFLDLYSIAAPVLANWNIDGVHMQGAWYKHIISQILQTLCPV